MTRAELYTKLRMALRRSGHYHLDGERVMAAVDAIEQNRPLDETLSERGMVGKFNYISADEIAALEAAMKGVKE